MKNIKIIKTKFRILFYSIIVIIICFSVLIASYEADTLIPPKKVKCQQSRELDYGYYLSLKGPVNKEIHWKFTTSNPLVELTVAILKEESLSDYESHPTSNEYNILTDFEASGVYKVESSGIYLVIFLNADDDKQTTTIYYDVRFISIKWDLLIMIIVGIIIGLIITIPVTIIVIKRRKKGKEI